MPHHNDGLAELTSTYRLFDFERWDFDQRSGLLSFSNAGVPRLHMPAQGMGSFSTSSSTWLWAWANSSLLAPLTLAAQRVHQYGITQAVPELTTSRLDASEDSSWHLAAVGAFLVNGIAVYRCPISIGALFLSLESVTRAS